MKKTIIFSILLIAIQAVSAQDQPISAFTTSPITINPAATGTFGNNNLRVNAGYNWNTISVSFPDHIIRFSADKSLLNGKLGIGVDLNNEYNKYLVKQGGGMLSVAYNTGLFSNAYKLSAGMQAGLAQDSFDWGSLNLMDPDDPVLNSLGQEKDHVLYPDFSLGAMIFRNQGKSALNPWFGVSINHLFKPDVSFFSELHLPLARKLTINSGVDIPLSEHFELTPLVLYLYQDKVNELNLGCTAKYQVARFAFSMGGMVKEIYSNHNSFYDFSILASVGYAGFEFRIESLFLESQHISYIHRKMGFMGLCWNLPEGKK